MRQFGLWNRLICKHLHINHIPIEAHYVIWYEGYKIRHLAGKPERMKVNALERPSFRLDVQGEPAHQESDAHYDI
jgi:hypothetical protein